MLDSFLWCRYSPIAQLVERLTVNQDVVGSSPAGRVVILILEVINMTMPTITLGQLLKISNIEYPDIFVNNELVKKESVISELPESDLYLLDLNVSYFEVSAEESSQSPGPYYEIYLEK